MIEISSAAGTLLRREVIRAYKSIPKRGAEAGGLLCGTLSPSIRIESIVPIPIEYRLGPAYRLSDSDKANFQKAISSHRNVIGWYRSHTRAVEGTCDEDRDIARRFFPSRESAFLVCIPDAQYNVNGRWHTWREGANERVSTLPLGKFSLLEDAIDSAEQDEEPPPAPPAPAPPLPQYFPHPVPAFAPAFTAAPPPSEPSPWIRAAIIGSIAVALIIGVAFLLRDQSANSSVHANNVGLGMKVDRQGRALLIDWDRQSAAVLEATDATFTINEGTHSKVLRLSGKELHNGGVFYTPQTTDDVQVELALHGPGGNFAQSLRIVQDEKASAPAESPHKIP